MTEGTPTEAEIVRGSAALAAFVHAWELPLNSEELHEMVWAVLVHARSDGLIAEIGDEVGRQLAAFDEANERVRQAMRQKLSEQKRDEEDEGGVGGEHA